MYSLLRCVICVQYWWREPLDNICVFTEKRKKKAETLILTFKCFTIVSLKQAGLIIQYNLSVWCWKASCTGNRHVTVSATKVITVTEITYICLTGYGHVELHAANDGSKLPE